MLAPTFTLIVDDAISTGATIAAAVRLLRRLGIDIAAVVVAMKQTNRWAATMRDIVPAVPVHAVYACPLFERRDDGWWPVAGA